MRRTAESATMVPDTNQKATMRTTQVGSNEATGDPSWDVELSCVGTRPVRLLFQFMTRI